MRVTAINLDKSATVVQVVLDEQYVRAFPADKFQARDVHDFLAEATAAEDRVRAQRTIFMASRVIAFPEGGGA
jgi:hypothetical protein